MKKIIVSIVSLSMSYIIYKTYTSATDYQFTIAFLGGVVTLIVVQVIINSKKLFRNC